MQVCEQQLKHHGLHGCQGWDFIKEEKLVKFWQNEAQVLLVSAMVSSCEGLCLLRIDVH